MKSSTYTTARFLTALLTIALIAGHRYIPQKSLLLHPSGSSIIEISGYLDPIDGQSATWLDQNNFYWRCDIRSAGIVSVQGCGATLSWGVAFKDYQNVRKPTVVICQNDKSDEDGDGWGWENEQNCIVSRPSPATTEGAKSKTLTCLNASSDEDGDGWGWENEQSCRVANSAKIERHAPKSPCLNPLSDIDGDGEGLELGRRCQHRKSTLPIPLCTTTAEHYHNGWGWENEDFCKEHADTTDSEDIIESQSNKETLAALKKSVRLEGIDFSDYDSMKLKIYYEGRASHLRVYLRNANPLYTNENDHNSAKFMSHSVLTEDLTTGAFTVKLADFSVSEWWALDFKVPRQYSGPEFDNIVSLGVDHTSTGVHKVRLERVELSGEWLPREELLMLITLFWVFYLLAETIIRYASLRRYSEQTSDEITVLTRNTQQLKAETNALHERSVTDVLTGIFNRSGIAQFADALFKDVKANNSLCLMIIDIDHFKQVNDTFGHDIGDNILKCVTDLISSNIRENDIFGRWGGEEFVLLCQNTSASQMMSLGEKLRLVVEQHNFEVNLELEVTISIGVTSIRKGETFNEAFKRADIALYTAKNERNKVSFQS